MNAGLLIFAVVFGLAGYLEAQRFGRQYGSTPWNWDPWVWAVICFLSFLIGVILLAISERQGRNRAANAIPPAYAGTGGYPAAPGMPTAQVSAPAAPGAGFWAADPSGRFEYRWWDGQQWTSSVSRGGVLSQDPPA